MRIELPTPLDADTTPNLADELSGAITIKVSAGEFRCSRLRLSQGASRDVELLMIDTGTVRAAICPTRGMSLWKARMAGIDLGWKSPVEGPIHPNFVALDEPSGLGWLDGFDELLVRCGLRSFGAPDFNANGQLKFPLHGRVGNLPARNVAMEVDQAHSLLHVTGEVHETRFLQYNLRLQVKYTFAIGENSLAIHDVVTNAGATPSTMQMLYHINVGAPFLQAGVKLHHPSQYIVARDARAAEDLDTWPTYLPPTAGYAEQVYFSASQADSHGWTQSLLASPNSDVGVAIHYRPDTLPFFSQWKNCVAESDGYVTGLEPGTGFPNPQSFEEQKGRLVQLAAGQSRDFQLSIEVIPASDRILGVIKQIDAARGGPAKTRKYDPHWCVSES